MTHPLLIGIAFDGFITTGEAIALAQRAVAAGAGSLWVAEHLGYREAMRGGRSITETNLKLLDETADKVMLDLLRMAEKNVGKKTPSRKASRNK